MNDNHEFSGPCNGRSARLLPASRGHRCPICGRGEWCSVAEDGSICVCMRVEHGSVKRTRNGGFLHRLNCATPPQNGRPRGTRTVWARVGSPGLHFSELAETYRRAARLGDVETLAQMLGLSTESLYRLGIGWAYDEGRTTCWDAGDVIRAARRVWAFPMSNVAGAVLGIRLRTDSGEKYAIRGGREGLFIPDGLRPGDRLLVAEGPTDTAALLDLGFTAVGRPNCTGGTSLLVDAVQRLLPLEVVIFADGDAPGRRGAEMLAATLAAYSPRLRVLVPPEGIKDVRAWKQVGATATDVLLALDASAPRRLAVIGRRIGRGGRKAVPHVH